MRPLRGGRWRVRRRSPAGAAVMLAAILGAVGLGWLLIALAILAGQGL